MDTVIHSALADRARSADRWTDRANILGVGVSAITIPRALRQFEQWITTGARQYVCVADVHAIMQSRWSEEFRRIHNGAGMVTPDGMPLVRLAQLARVGEVDRVYGPDLLMEACAFSVARGYRHFFLGGGPGVAEELERRMARRFPGLQIAGSHMPPFRPTTLEEDAEVARIINEARPDFVWVGLSTPKQEYWMAKFRPNLDAAILLGIGAAFDFHSGNKPQAPKLIQRSGFEWLFRLATEPRRLWPRYRRVIPQFLYLIARQKLGLEKFPID
ncbi:MAG: glycosyl transferase, WecB/TagA/CpsF family [Rhodospirillales bacterium]|nr:glycosyl transferase, WecB/TagA/CpsF family [Rhodospirillales bacterium]